MRFSLLSGRRACASRCFVFLLVPALQSECTPLRKIVPKYSTVLSLNFQSSINEFPRNAELRRFNSEFLLRFTPEFYFPVAEFPRYTIFYIPVVEFRRSRWISVVVAEYNESHITFALIVWITASNLTEQPHSLLLQARSVCFFLCFGIFYCAINYIMAWRQLS